MPEERSRLPAFARGDIADLDISRPWSPDEVTVLMQRVVVKLEAETSQLKVQGELAAQAKRDAEILTSQWMLIAKTERPDLKSDAMREAWILQDTETGVAEAQFEADRAERLYKDQSTVVRAIQHQGEQLRSMISRHTHLEKTWHPVRDGPN
jgi:hypothetical protein